MHISKIFCCACLFFVIGIALGNFLPVNIFYLYIFFLAGFAAIFIFRRNKKLQLASLLAVFFVLGFGRFQLTWPQIDEHHIAFYLDQSFEFTGQVVDEPDIRVNQAKLTIGKINDLTSLAPLAGRVLVYAPNFPRIQYGDYLRLVCALEPGGVIEDFDYGKYLAARKIYAVCYRPDDFQVIAPPAGARLATWQKVRQKIIAFKLKSKSIIDLSVSYPSSEVLSAMLIGLGRNIPEDVKTDFSRAGISHIIAISGLHISIITLILFNLLLAAHLNRRQSFYVSVPLILLFLLFIGFRASSIRAGIMGILTAYAAQAGKLCASINILLLAAVFLLLINPGLLFADIGFELSFLAMLGIMLYKNYLQGLLGKISIPEKFEIRSMLAMTLSAQVLVLPLVVFYFGNLSLVAPLVNLFVLPLLPFVMIIGFLLIFAGLIHPALAMLIGYPLDFIVEAIIALSRVSVDLPFSFLSIKKIEFVWIIFIYLCIGWLTWFIRSNKKHHYDF